jgi:hypothetical protein
MTHLTRRTLLATGAALALAALGCAGSAEQAARRAQPPASALSANPARGQWPAAVRNGGPAVLAAYQFAAERPDLLKHMPCFCGCGAEGLSHRSNLDCFVDGPTGDGRLTLDAHGINCGTCVAVALQTRALAEQGLSARAIRAAIDARWSKSGPPTDTPPP